MSDSLHLHGLQPARLLCLWDSPSKNTRAGCQYLVQRIFLTQVSNAPLLCLLNFRQVLHPLGHQGRSIPSWDHNQNKKSNSSSPDISCMMFQAMCISFPWVTITNGANLWYQWCHSLSSFVPGLIHIRPFKFAWGHYSTVLTTEQRKASWALKHAQWFLTVFKLRRTQHSNLGSNVIWICETV